MRKSVPYHKGKGYSSQAYRNRLTPPMTPNRNTEFCISTFSQKDEPNAYGSLTKTQGAPFPRSPAVTWTHILLIVLYGAPHKGDDAHLVILALSVLQSQLAKEEEVLTVSQSQRNH